MAEKRIESIACGIAEGMGAACTVNYIRGYSPVINNDEMYTLWKETAEELLGEDNVHLIENAGLGGEDFSFFAEQVPGIFFHLGCRTEGGKNAPAHNECFMPNTDGFVTGQRVMITTALKYLAKK